jgi:Peptidase family M1 domain
MEKALNMLRRALLFIPIISLLFLAACSGSGLPGMLISLGPTVTPIQGPLATMTPFGPKANLATDVPTLPSTDTLPMTQTPQPANTPTSSPMLTPATPTNSPTPSITILPGPTPVFIPSKYTLSVSLDYAGHVLSTDETISYTNSTGDSLHDLVLAVEPNLWKECFSPGTITVNGQTASGFTLNSDRLDIPLSEALAPNGTLELFLHYDLNLPAADVYHVFGYNDYQTNLVDWYPFIVPYISGQGWLLHPPANVGEHLAYDVESFDMTLHLTDPNLHAIIAASAPAETISFGWRYRLEDVRSFAFSVSAGYKTASTKVNGVTVKSYFFNSESAQGQAVLNEVAKALTTFNTLFGPDPYPSLSIIESPFYDGMEYDGLFFLSRAYYLAENGTVLNNLIDIAVHETAHQWWFGLVGNDQAMDPWLDEALATYSERLFYEQNYPEVNAWQSFRVDAYNPTGWVDTDIYHGVDFRTYANAVYLRGAQFLQALRTRVGDEVFFAFLKDYAAQMAGKRATSADFFRILRQHTNANISDLLSEFFQNPY